MNNIYNSKYIQDLFDEMSSSYHFMNLITSFGLSEICRRKTFNKIDLNGEKIVLDLFSGMGESLKYLSETKSENKEIILLDFSKKMIQNLKKKQEKNNELNINILQEDFFENKLESQSLTTIVSCYGLKTLTKNQIEKLAIETERLLKSNGEFVFTEISVPKNNILKKLFLFYIQKIIPLIGRFCLKNNESYKMLGIYVSNFKNSKKAYDIFKKKNFELEYISFFFGCVTGIKGRKTNEHL